MYEQKLLEEAAEAKRAEKIVKALEKKVIQIPVLMKINMVIMIEDLIRTWFSF